MSYTQGVATLLTVDFGSAGWDGAIDSNFTDLEAAVNDALQMFVLEDFDLNITTSQDVFTVPTGFKFIFSHCVLAEPTASAATGVFRLGSSGTAATSLVTDKTLTNFTATDDQVLMGRGNPGGGTPLAASVLAAGDVCQGDMQTAIGGAGTCDLYVYGHMVAV